MIKKKVCMLGAFAVGKTSLVQRFVHSIFSEKYITTLGVKIDKKTLHLDHGQVELILWDLAGEDEFMKVRSSYLRGSSGYLLVADGTRAETLDIAQQLNQRIKQELGGLPFILLVNKSDLHNNWQIDQQQLEQLRAEGWQVIETSALNNDNVEAAFTELSQRMLNA
jgi:hypothetical protein